MPDDTWDDLVQAWPNDPNHPRPTRLWWDEQNHRVRQAVLKALDGGTRKPQTYNTPLHWAVSTGCWEAVQAMLAAGWSACAVNVQGETPLHWAVTYNVPDTIVETLISHGALSVFEQPSMNKPALMRSGFVPNVIDEECSARWERWLGMGLPLLGDEVSQATLLVQSAAAGRDDLVVWFLNHGVNANGVDNLGETALLAATAMKSNQRETIVAILLQQGANPNVCNNHGQTPLHKLATTYQSWGHRQEPSILAVLDMLMEHGANPWVQDNEGVSACDEARRAAGGDNNSMVQRLYWWHHRREVLQIVADGAVPAPHATSVSPVRL